MGNRLKEQQATKTYEVRSGSLYTKKMGTLVRNMKRRLQQESRRRDQQSSFSKGPSRCLRPPLHMRLFARPGCPVTKYIAIKKARNRTQLSCSVSRNSQALAKKEAYLKKAAKRSKPTSSKLTYFMLCKEFAITAQFFHERRPVKLVSKIFKETQPLPLFPSFYPKKLSQL